MEKAKKINITLSISTGIYIKGYTQPNNMFAYVGW